MNVLNKHARSDSWCWPFTMNRAWSKVNGSLDDVTELCIHVSSDADLRESAGIRQKGQEGKMFSFPVFLGQELFFQDVTYPKLTQSSKCLISISLVHLSGLVSTCLIHSVLITHQIFSLVQSDLDVLWLNVPNFQNCQCWKEYMKDNKYSQLGYLTIYCQSYTLGNQSYTLRKLIASDNRMSADK